MSQLDDRIKGRVRHGKNPGPSTVLSKEEEDALVAYLVHMAKQGFPLTPRMTTAFGWAIAIRSGKADRFPDEGLSKNWFTRFCKRHPERKVRLPARFKRSDDTVESSDGNESDTVCEKCLKREPDGCNERNVFWICDRWFHVFCIYGKNYTKS